MRSKSPWAVSVASVFGIGYWPLMPGTWASLYAAGLAYLLQIHFGPAYVLALVGISSWLCLWSVASIQKNNLAAGDPPWVVMDEIAGQSLVFVYVFGSELWLLPLGFLLFRLFDILKPWPISWADRKFKNAFGVLFDDLLAGFFAGIVLLCLQVYYSGAAL
jgi:phosphatidylglycerophosphatase A